jgi:8-oxo-dGTP pyrophosphatase MutT (NUDIX family)
MAVAAPALRAPVIDAPGVADYALPVRSRFDLESVRAQLARLPAAGDSPEPGQRAAVAAVLRQHAPARGAELLFIRRAEHPEDPWSGHMAFPGGRHDETDATLLATALRETREEVGLDLGAHGTLLTRLPDVPAIARGRRMGLVIAPFVFALEAPDCVLALNDEVAEALWIPLEALVSGEGAGTLAYVHEGQSLQLPCVRYQGRVVWGLTFQMLQYLLTVLRAA